MCYKDDWRKFLKNKEVGKPNSDVTPRNPVNVFVHI